MINVWKLLGNQCFYYLNFLIFLLIINYRGSEVDNEDTIKL